MTATLSSPRRRFSAASNVHSAKSAVVASAVDEHWKRRAKRLLATEIDFISNPSFRTSAEETDAAGQADAVLTAETGFAGRLPADLPAHLARLCEANLLAADQERALFRQMNLRKFQAHQVRSRLNPERPEPQLIERADGLLEEARQLRDRIIRGNMRLVISIVKKFVNPQNSFDELLSDGIVALMQAVDKFDYDRGFRFSTYAYRAIARNAYRTVVQRQKEAARFSSDAVWEAEERDASASLSEQDWSRIRGNLTEMLDHLDRRERFIIRGRFALGGHRKVRTFQNLADKLGVSKERVRQLEQRAVVKLKAMATEVAWE